MPDYERLQRLGAGAFGEVWLVYDHALDVKRAVKYVRKDRIHDATNFYNEPRTLMALQHDHIVQVTDAGKESDGTLYIAMQYYPWGSVESRFKSRPVPLSRARNILCGVCWGIEYAHAKGYIHRDIKPANILLDDQGRGKLSDFGLAAKALVGESASPEGYLTHLAPEVLSDNSTSQLTDIYALGVTAYRLVNGDGYLPRVADFGELEDMILAGQYPDRSRYRPWVPPTMKRIINAAMAVDPNLRIKTAAEFRHKLERIDIKCDWRIRQLSPDVVKYQTSVDGKSVVVMVTAAPDGGHRVETRKGKIRGASRRVSAMSFKDLTRHQMDSSLRKILTGFVQKGL